MGNRRYLLASLTAAVLLLPLATPGPAAAGAAGFGSNAWIIPLASGVSKSPYWGPQAYAAPAVGDMWADGRMEIVTALPNGGVYAYYADNHTVVPGWPKITGAAISGSPALADLRGDGHLEAVVASEDGWMYAWNADGSNLPGWPRYTYYGPNFNFLPGFIGGPAVGDLFGDGRREIVAAGADHFLYAWDSNGTVLPGFPINLWDSTVDTPALTDLLGNGHLDIVVGGDSVPGHPGLGSWYAFPPTGCPYPDASYPNNVPNICTLPGWPKFIDETAWSSPASTLVNGSYKVFTGTGHYYSQTTGGPHGRYVSGYNGDGSNALGWPQTTPSQPNFGSVALGQLGGSGSPQVVGESEDGNLYTWNAANGSGYANVPFNQSTGYPCCSETSVSPIGSPTIAPVDGTGVNGVWAGTAGRLNGFSGVTGNAIDHYYDNSNPGFYYAAPSVVDLGDGHLSVVAVWANGNNTAWYLGVFPIPGTSGGSMTANGWPTFHQNMQRSGAPAPLYKMSSSTHTNHTDFTVSWSPVAGSVVATSSNLWVRDNTANTGWLLYAHIPGTSMSVIGIPGHTYDFFVDAQNANGSASIAKSAQLTVAVGIGDTRSSPPPFAGLYVNSGYGNIGTIASPMMFPSVSWPGWKIARAIGVESGGGGGQIMDGWGALHPFGNAQGLATSAYWSGWDIARGIALNPAGTGGYTLDGWGGIHQFGNAVAKSSTVYWPGWDIARGIVLNPCDNTHSSGYVLDGWGGLHPFGVAPSLDTSAYWPGWDIARAVAVSTCSGGAFTGDVLDGWGGVHPFTTHGSAMPPGVQISAFWPSWDITRGIVVIPGSTTNQGYVLDGWGNLHPFNGAAGVTNPIFSPGNDIFRGVAIG